MLHDLHGQGKKKKNTIARAILWYRVSAPSQRYVLSGEAPWVQNLNKAKKKSDWKIQGSIDKAQLHFVNMFLPFHTW